MLEHYKAPDDSCVANGSKPSENPSSTVLTAGPIDQTGFARMRFGACRVIKHRMFWILEF